MSEESKYVEKECPSIHGNQVGFKVEYKNKDGAWLNIPTSECDFPKGIPYPLCDGKILSKMSMFGYNQAKAFCYGFKAIAESGLDEDLPLNVDTRIISYKIQYDISCYRSTEDNFESMNDRWGDENRD